MTMPMIDWLSWGGDAFDRARLEGKPILLSISASWCHWCHEMDRTTYGDGRVAGLIGNSFVPIRVDADDLALDIFQIYSLSLRHRGSDDHILRRVRRLLSEHARTEHHGEDRRY